MTQTVSSTIQRRRLVLAIAIAVVIVFSPAAIGLVLPEQTMEEGVQARYAFSFGRDASTPDVVLDEIETQLDRTG